MELASAMGGPAAMVASHLVHGGVEPLDRHHLVDDAEVRGPLSADDLAGEGQALGLVQPDPLGQQPRRAEVEAEAPLGEDQREPGPRRAPHHVGREGHSEAGAHGHTVHLGDHRPGAVVYGHHRVGDVAHVVHPVPAWLVSGHLLVVSGTDVGAGAEVAPRPGYDNRPGRRHRDLAEPVPQGIPHGDCAGVLAAGPVDGDGGDRTGGLDADAGMRHGCSRNARRTRQVFGGSVRAPDLDATQPRPRLPPAPLRPRRRPQ